MLRESAEMPQHRVAVRSSIPNYRANYSDTNIDSAGGSLAATQLFGLILGIVCMITSATATTAARPRLIGRDEALIAAIE